MVVSPSPKYDYTLVVNIKRQNKNRNNVIKYKYFEIIKKKCSFDF